MIADIIRSLPKWLVITAFFLLVAFMVISISFGTFKIAGYEFGFPKNTNRPISYRVVGNVQKLDQKSPTDITVLTQFPPFYPDSNGAIIGLKVWKDPDGSFPNLAFSQTGYAVVGVDLNDTAKVEEHDGELKIKETIVLKPIPEE